MLFFGCTLIVAAQNPAPAPAQQAQQYYSRGLELEKAGDVEGAKAAFAKALQLNPQLADARYRLGQLKLDRGEIAKETRATKFGAMIIPQIALDDASLSDSVEVLRVLMEKASDGAPAPNFVIKDPDRKLDKATVSFQLKAVPAKAILDYILSQAEAKATFEEHAVVIEPRS